MANLIPTKLSSLGSWLDYISLTHPNEIEMGLCRVREVYIALGKPLSDCLVITVAGTNGKGSTVTLTEAVLLAHGCRVGAYTSPHIQRFNERIRILGVDVDECLLVEAFDEVERARGDIALTYFEYSTLAAFCVFRHAGLEVCILEIGLGGRLDAVNVIDSSIAVITNIDIDHQDWLGNDLNSIAREKAAIMRPNKPVFIGEDMPIIMAKEVRYYKAEAYWYGEDFVYSMTNSQLDLSLANISIPNVHSVLPANNVGLAGAVAVRTLAELGTKGRPVNLSLFAKALSACRPAGRLEYLSKRPDVLTDVGHNPGAARFLKKFIQQTYPDARLKIAVFSALDDKDYPEIIQILSGVFDTWFIAELDTPRAAKLVSLESKVGRVTKNMLSFSSIEQALSAALEKADQKDDVMLVFGSFYVVEAAKSYFETL